MVSVQKIEYKEILTPQWRESSAPAQAVEEVPLMEDSEEVCACH